VGSPRRVAHSSVCEDVDVVGQNWPNVLC
jgi:hypothetical protein